MRACRAAWLAALLAVPAWAGEIAGLPPQLPVFVERDFEVAFSNDFLGRGGSTDDFRSQQMIVSAKLADRWRAHIDHSILTLDDGPEPGRIDQMSASLGYEFMRHDEPGRLTSLVAGVGIRGVGSYGGERMQNGFHRLVRAKIVDLPYADLSGHDATAWLDANHYQVIGERGDAGPFGDWRRGIWLRAGSLATAAGQWDSSLAAFGVMSRGPLDIWLGLRGDWRSGYGDTVLRETAAAEEDYAVAFGVRYGALVLETVQQLNNNASYGQIRLVSAGSDSRNDVSAVSALPPFELEVGMSVPDVQLRVAGKQPVRWLTARGSAWRESAVIAASYGEPQYRDDSGSFVLSGQLDAGLEFSRPWVDRRERLRVYAATGAGWRYEELVGVDRLRRVGRRHAGSAVVTLAAGLRFASAATRGDLHLETQLGLFATLPLDDADLRIADERYTLQRPALNLVLGLSVAFD
jgi:hypothetical protein